MEEGRYSEEEYVPPSSHLLPALRGFLHCREDAGSEHRGGGQLKSSAARPGAAGAGVDALQEGLAEAAEREVRWCVLQGNRQYDQAETVEPLF